MLCALLAGFAGDVRATRAADEGGPTEKVGADAPVGRREEVFAFAKRPEIVRRGSGFEIRFETTAFCDATVAVEDAAGRIVRHLASGVLGPTAPAPFRPGSRAQAVPWDGKDDKGRYVDPLAGTTVRVGLGLAPRFERTLFWEPHKRVGKGPRPLIVPRPEGVYVFEGEGVDQLKLFDHAGEYVRTIYPFPADRLAACAGLERRTFPQSGAVLPVKHGPKHHATLLTSGDNLLKEPGKYGSAATAMAVHGDRILLASIRLNRLATDGSTGGVPLEGPSTSIPCRTYRTGGTSDEPVGPRSAAISPDGRRLYVTGFVWDQGWPRGHAWLHGVGVLDLTRDDAQLETFAGVLTKEGGGKGESQFDVPTSVACDAEGRVYVADYWNDRIQVFDADRRLLKSIPVPRPAEIALHPRTGAIHVFSWFLKNLGMTEKTRVPAAYRRLGPFDDPTVKFETPLALERYSEGPNLRWDGLEFHAAVDGYVDPPTIWLIAGKMGTTEELEILRGNGGGEDQARKGHPRLLVERDGKLETVRDFGADVVRSVKRAKPPVISRQRLYVDPRTGILYVAEGDSGVMKSFRQLVACDPRDGSLSLVDLPFTAEDMAFGREGDIYLRTDTHVVRYRFDDWREVPWDYGEEVPKVGFDPSLKTAPSVSALPLPAENRPAWFHLGGMHVNARGHLALACFNSVPTEDRREFAVDGSLKSKWAIGGGRKYAPTVFPGRVRFGEVHVWDEHGQLLHEDAVPGLGATDGIALDRDGRLYVLASAQRVGPHGDAFLPWTETLFKFAPRQGRVQGAAERATVPLAKESRPTRPPDMTSDHQGATWVDGAEWFFGGVGFGNRTGGCVCWNARFALDDFARTFVPEVDHFTVAVLDARGNLVTRIGRYGNVDDGLPLVASGGPSAPRAVGGDEVALFHAAYVGVHTDRRLFVADAGNRRLASVLLKYRAEAQVAVPTVPGDRKALPVGTPPGRTK